MKKRNHIPTYVTRGLGVAALVLGLTAVGCGNTAKSGQAKAEFADYCAKSLAIETYPEPDFSNFDSLPHSKQVELVKQSTSQLLPLGEAVLAAAPAAVKADDTVQIDTLRKANQTGDPSGFDNPVNNAAKARTHSFDLANCGWSRADVTATEYAFAGMPPSVKPGALSIQLTNTGKEPHDLHLFRINDGVSESVKDILALPEAEAMKRVTMLGTVFAPPGGADYMVTKLKKGRYGVECLVPLGEHHDGPPHASKGMFASFTVA